jgi:hypothetical protein
MVRQHRIINYPTFLRMVIRLEGTPASKAVEVVEDEIYVKRQYF